MAVGPRMASSPCTLSMSAANWPLQLQSRRWVFVVSLAAAAASTPSLLCDLQTYYKTHDLHAHTVICAEGAYMLPCRALLQDAHVLALDEATANVDQATDALIQQALRDAVNSTDGTSPRRTLLVHLFDSKSKLSRLIPR